MLSHKTPRVLFILKRREDYHECQSYSHTGLSTGLLNSATFVHNMLLKNNIESKIAVVIDNNCIDKEVNLFKPTHVIIEALWVVPSKFEVLTKLHPNVKWIVRFHRETPFIANEGIAMKWSLEYAKYNNVYLGINAPRYLNDVKIILAAAGLDDCDISDKVIYLPNYYPISDKTELPKRQSVNKTHVNVGCFGAIRPLKNQLLQAIAALRFADEIGKVLHFHINVNRVEQKGDSILKNLISLFEGIAENDHKLVVHEWAPHEDFIKVLRKMDIGLQVSFTETFNIVAADMVTSGVPIVISKEIPWAEDGTADPTNSLDVANALIHAWRYQSSNVMTNVHGLRKYIDESEQHWVNYLSAC